MGRIVIKKNPKTKIPYRYWQESHRVSGKVKTTTVYLGPLIPKRRGGFVLIGLVTMGIHAAKGTLGPAGGTEYKGKMPSPDARTMAAERERWFQQSLKPDRTMAELRAEAIARGGRPHSFPASGINTVSPVQTADEQAAHAVVKGDTATESDAP